MEVHGADTICHNMVQCRAQAYRAALETGNLRESDSFFRKH